MARATFGGHDSVATATGGKPGASASTSPPPVWMSREADASLSRSPSSRAYPHGGRSSVARPSSQPKSQPVTSASSPSAISSSNGFVIPPSSQSTAWPRRSRVPW